MANFLDLLSKIFGPKEPDSLKTIELPSKPWRQCLSLPPTQRDEEIRNQIIAGNVPSWLKTTVPVTTTAVINGSLKTLVFHVFPDYLLVGSDRDYCSANMCYKNASEIAASLGCTLPTRKMVNLIYEKAQVKLTPHPMPPTAAMQSSDYMRTQNEVIEQEKKQKSLSNGMLLVGHKKDVVISSQSIYHPGMECIYGWHMANGNPIQPLSFAHDQMYSDYSHGARMVLGTVQLDGVDMRISQILTDQSLYVLISDEGRFK